MKISQLITRLERLKREHGDIEILREDGTEFTMLFIDKLHPLKNRWQEDRKESVSE